ncbi:MAG: 16S rRNA (guanine(966)-N(2))-methyltransferase RsmD [Chloroflexi bacterium]|nr:16S rRNA (guanine(966)-N(2))-methyltransferase RsmD [Chloroflexota bacterium]
MRVIAGEAKGHRLQAPRGRRARPTSGRVRAAIFSMLPSIVPLPRRALDLYAGSGALGIEALSRGVEQVDFVERDRRHCQTIRQNLAAAGLAGQGRVLCGRAQSILPRLEGAYDVVFLDPPYGDPSLPALLEELGDSPLLSGESAVVVERSSRQTLKDTFGRLRLVRELRHGDTAVSVYKLNGREEKE